MAGEGGKETERKGREGKCFKGKDRKGIRVEGRGKKLKGPDSRNLREGKEGKSPDVRRKEKK